MIQYLYKYRLGAEGRDTVFCETNSQALNTSRINAIINSAWTKAGLASRYGDISITLNRKGLISSMRNKDSEIGLAMASQMCHSNKTSDMYYDVRNLQKMSVVTTHKIRMAVATHPNPHGAPAEVALAMEVWQTNPETDAPAEAVKQAAVTYPMQKHLLKWHSRLPW